MTYYLVAPSTVVRENEKAFTYHSQTPLAIGTMVRISVGKKELNGVVLATISKKPSFKTKPIQAVLTSTPLPPALLSLADWMSIYYATHFATVLQTLLPAGAHKQRRQKESTTVFAKRERTNIVLNSEQSSAVKAIAEQNNGTFLLHGVPGSGKTQVYIEATRHELARGKSAIVLVPEIALTPQLVAEFMNHFPQVVVTHSHMTEAERHKAWLRVLESTEPLVVIGPRSALFMPIRDLGIIIIDEAHEPSYKQDQAPRYSALRAASMLAKFHASAKVILGSATPSIQDYYLAEQTKSPILTLPKPAVATQPPRVELIDLRKKELFKQHRFLSDELINTMRDALENQKQVLIFHNRRGTAPTTLCTTCGWSALCDACFVPTTLHADSHQLLCHICGRSQSVPPSCPSCKNPDIVFRGIGTKLIESEIRKLFPRSRVARFDADSTAEETLDKRYQDIYDGNIDIMIGTQILAKGLDIPNLSVVGVIQADSGLHLPDYQAEERVFQLLYQVAGRAGRSKHEGHVIVQSFVPDHPVIKLALARDFARFYDEQLHERRTAYFPPFTHLLKLTTSYKTEAGAIRAARKLASELRAAHKDVLLLGPTPAFYERLNGNYRWQLLIKGKNRAKLATIAKQIPSGWHVDLDASNLL